MLLQNLITIQIFRELYIFISKFILDYTNRTIKIFFDYGC